MPRAPIEPPVEQPLAYAEPGVRSPPRRTLLRIVGRWAWNGLRTITRLVQALLLGLGYGVLGVAILTRAALVIVAMTLLCAGRARWDGPAVRVWAVRTFNRARIKLSGPFRRRREPVPLATPHAAGRESPSLHPQPLSMRNRTSVRR